MSTTFADVMPVKQTSSHTYTVNLEDPWCIGIVPNGGYITSTFLMVARTHMEMTHSSRHQSDIINLHLEFLRPTSIGTATFTVQDVKIGSRISNLHLVLSQPKDSSNPKSPIQDEVQGYITISSIEQETGPTHRTDYRLYPRPLTVSFPQLLENKDENYIQRRGDPHGTFRRAHKNITMYPVKPSRRTPTLPPSITDQWVRFTPVQHPDKPARWTNDALGLLVDIFPQIHERYVNEDLEDATLTLPSELSDTRIHELAQSKKKTGTYAAFWYPTLLLNLDVKTKLPDEGVEWLFVRVQAKKIAKGRFDLAVEVWDDPLDGELIALSTHACLVVDSNRNTRKKKKEEQKPESKM